MAENKTEMQQLLDMLERAKVDFEIIEGTTIKVEYTFFIFHIDERLKETYVMGSEW